jgi:hypothetical protein
MAVDADGGDAQGGHEDAKLAASIAALGKNVAGLRILLREADRQFGPEHTVAAGLRKELEEQSERLGGLRKDRQASLPKSVLLRKEERARDETQAKLDKTVRDLAAAKLAVQKAQ